MITKRYVLGFVAAVSFSVLAFGLARAVRADAETVSGFNSRIILERDGTLSVAETITYDFDSNERHGILRDIPLASPNGPNLVVDVTGVDDGQGRSYPYSDSVSGNTLDVKIGDPNVSVSGVETYVINYVVHNAVREFSDHDEVYWNVTGNGWNVPLGNVSASVALPEEVSGLAMACYTGPAGAKGTDCNFSEASGGVNYSATRTLNAGEGLSIVLGIPLGHLTVSPAVVVPESSAPSGSGGSGGNLSLIPGFIFFFVFIVFAVRTSLWRRRSGFGGVSLRMKSKPVIPKELKNQPVVVAYGPPDNLRPIDVGTIIDRRVDMADVSSVIMDLAVRGYLKIRYTVRQIKFWPDKKDFELVKLKDGSDLVHPAEKIIFNLLFTARGSVSLSDLQGSRAVLFETLKNVGKVTDDDIYAEGYFDAAARTKRDKSRMYFGGGMFVLLLLLLAGIFFGGDPGLMIFIALAAVVLTVIEFGRSSTPELTPKGVAALQQILGFREFLRYTEEDRLKMMDAPELKPETFEKFLPYAMVLGVENEWAKKFEGIYTAMPAWYEDPTMTAFNGSLLVANLAFFNTSFNQAFSIASAPATSGFGAGGFSGGGFGGGGGGSW